METGRMSEGPCGSPGFVSSVSDKGRIRSVLVANHIAHWSPQNHPKGPSRRLFSLRFFSNLADCRDGCSNRLKNEASKRNVVIHVAVTRAGGYHPARRAGGAAGAEIAALI